MKQRTEFAIVLVAFAVGAAAAWMAKELGASYGLQLISLLGVVFLTTWTEVHVGRALGRTLRAGR